MSEGFFSRWSQRKQAARETTPSPATQVTPPAPAPGDGPAPPLATPVSATPAAPAEHPTAAKPVPTLDDVRALTPEADFAPFMQSGVAPEVRNAAVKRLFTDPHFNVMDGLDIYIDDYNRPDPLPAGMLQKMVGARLLGLVSDEPAAPPSGPGGANPSAALSPVQPPPPHQATAAVAQSQPLPTDPSEPPLHDHAHLQLQPDPAAGPSGPDAARG